MATLTGVIASAIEPVPKGYNLEEFSLLVNELDQLVLAGKIDPAFVLGGLRAIRDGVLVRRDFPVWKTLTMPRIHRHYTEYAYKLNDAGCKKRGDLVTFYHAEEYNKYDLDVDIVRVTPRDLGFFQKMHTRRSTLYERAIELGLELAWPEIGLALRLAYLDQPKGEWLTVPTNVVDPVVFDRTMRIGNSPYEDKTRGIAGVLGIDLSVTEKHVRADEEFVFIKPRKEEAS